MTGNALEIEDRGLSNRGGNGLSTDGDEALKAVSDLESLGENPSCVMRGLPSNIGVGGGEVEVDDTPGIGRGSEFAVIGVVCVAPRNEFALPAHIC